MSDPFKLQYRSALLEVVSQLVRQGLQASQKNIEMLAGPVVSPSDLPRFIELVANELANLHEETLLVLDCGRANGKNGKR
jgi:hypothetical protein